MHVVAAFEKMWWSHFETLGKICRVLIKVAVVTITSPMTRHHHGKETRDREGRGAKTLQYMDVDGYTLRHHSTLRVLHANKDIG
jgi:hypothetical protein